MVNNLTCPLWRALQFDNWGKLIKAVITSQQLKLSQDWKLWSNWTEDGKKVMVEKAWLTQWCFKFRVTSIAAALWQRFQSHHNFDKILGNNAKIVTVERRPSTAMAAKICATVLPIMGLFLLPLGALGVPLGAGKERQELLQEKVCYYQVPHWSETFSTSFWKSFDNFLSSSLLQPHSSSLVCHCTTDTSSLTVSLARFVFIAKIVIFILKPFFSFVLICIFLSYTLSYL